MATLNLAHGRGVSTHPLGQLGLPREEIETNLSAIAAELRALDADVVALQEADASSEWSGNFDHVASLGESAGYPHRFHGLHVDDSKLGLRLRYGAALIARRPLARTQSTDFHAKFLDAGKGFVMAEVQFEDRPVLVVSVHLHSKLAAQRRRQARQMIEVVERALKASTPESDPARPGLVVMGDFNAYWEDADDAVRMVAHSLNLSAHEPFGPGSNTYPSTDPQVRIDWILVSESLRFQTHGNWSSKHSDHIGVTADLAWR